MLSFIHLSYNFSYYLGPNCNGYVSFESIGGMIDKLDGYIMQKIDIKERSM